MGVHRMFRRWVDNMMLNEWWWGRRGPICYRIYALCLVSKPKCIASSSHIRLVSSIITPLFCLFDFWKIISTHWFSRIERARTRVDWCRILAMTMRTRRPIRSDSRCLHLSLSCSNQFIIVEKSASTELFSIPFAIIQRMVGSRPPPA